MQVRKEGPGAVVVLTAAELRLLGRALERASFIDTPVDEQAEIAAFAGQALEELRRSTLVT